MSYYVTVTSKKQREIIDNLLMVWDLGITGWAATHGAREMADVLIELLERRAKFPDRYVSGVRLPFEIELNISSRGIVSVAAEPEWIEWLEALDGIDLNRIRRCEVCEALFYAPREDSRACGEQHTSTLRQRDYRKWKGTKRND